MAHVRVRVGARRRAWPAGRLRRSASGAAPWFAIGGDGQARGRRRRERVLELELWRPGSGRLLLFLTSPGARPWFGRFGRLAGAAGTGTTDGEGAALHARIAAAGVRRGARLRRVLERAASFAAPTSQRDRRRPCELRSEGRHGAPRRRARRSGHRSGWVPGRRRRALEVPFSPPRHRLAGVAQRPRKSIFGSNRAEGAQRRQWVLTIPEPRGEPWRTTRWRRADLKLGNFQERQRRAVPVAATTPDAHRGRYRRGTRHRSGPGRILDPGAPAVVSSGRRSGVEAGVDSIVGICRAANPDRAGPSAVTAIGPPRVRLRHVWWCAASSACCVSLVAPELYPLFFPVRFHALSRSPDADARADILLS